ncbi:MAG: pilus assembly protein PilM [Pirellulales bacterium]|nr:pilus assembly protein PilM [Pirellulales bacterium]
MANKKEVGVWGIDIGQSALKALRCSYEGDGIVADAFDFIEYPKMLSEPDSNPIELVDEALEKLLSRNDLEGDLVTISVPGQAGLAKFFMPPPTEIKNIPGIVKFEAQQQIPFDLEDVIWDYQKMIGGTELEGLITDSEVGLFAMKRDQVLRQLEPFDRIELDLSVIQLAPMAMYNYITYDLLDNLPDADMFMADDPPESYVVLSIGTETTDLILTNGYRIRHRSIPIGGNHFTRQITTQLKLTFAKAEHLKRNARQAKDPKVVFQAMRATYQDMVTEIQRSLEYFRSLDRNVKIKEIIVTGNTVKLPGLQAFLSKNLDFDVTELDHFNRLGGSTVTESPAFKDNVLAFGNCYGLCLQGLGLAQLQTNLLPREIMIDRLVDSKKPWTIAAISLLLIAYAFNFFFKFGAASKVDIPQDATAAASNEWQQAINSANNVQTRSSNFKSQDKKLENELNSFKDLGAQLAGSTDTRIQWMELIRTINSILPEEQATVRDPDEVPFDQRRDFYIETVESQYFADLTEWYTEDIKKRQKETDNFFKKVEASADDATGPGGPSSPPATNDETAAAGVEGDGWVIELKGHHFYQNDNVREGGEVHVIRGLIEPLQAGMVFLPDAAGIQNLFVTTELGISNVILVTKKDDGVQTIRRGATSGGAGGMDGGIGGGAGIGGGGDQVSAEDEPTYTAKKYSFSVQFIWQPNLLTDRLKEQTIENITKKTISLFSLKRLAAANNSQYPFEAQLASFVDSYLGAKAVTGGSGMGGPQPATNNLADGDWIILLSAAEFFATDADKQNSVKSMLTGKKAPETLHADITRILQTIQGLTPELRTILTETIQVPMDTADKGNGPPIDGTPAG